MATNCQDFIRNIVYVEHSVTVGHRITYLSLPLRGVVAVVLMSELVEPLEALFVSLFFRYPDLTFTCDFRYHLTDSSELPDRAERVTTTLDHAN